MFLTTNTHTHTSNKQKNSKMNTPSQGKDEEIQAFVYVLSPPPPPSSSAYIYKCALCYSSVWCLFLNSELFFVSSFILKLESFSSAHMSIFVFVMANSLASPAPATRSLVQSTRHPVPHPAYRHIPFCFLRFPFSLSTIMNEFCVCFTLSYS